MKRRAPGSSGDASILLYGESGSQYGPSPIKSAVDGSQGIPSNRFGIINPTAVIPLNCKNRLRDIILIIQFIFEYIFHVF